MNIGFIGLPILGSKNYSDIILVPGLYWPMMAPKIRLIIKSNNESILGTNIGRILDLVANIGIQELFQHYLGTLLILANNRTQDSTNI